MHPGKKFFLKIIRSEIARNRLIEFNQVVAAAAALFSLWSSVVLLLLLLLVVTVVSSANAKNPDF